MKKIKIILFIIISVFLIGGCNSKEDNTLDEVLAKNNYIIVDVRTKEEFEVSHIKGAINIPYDEIDEDTILDNSKTILVYCKSGGRSNIAYNSLKNLGFDVIDLGAFDSINLEKE